ncbi:(Fe-S)-binding protein [Saccharolobus shibatae]|uniref:(Fe-S)-binding protein n=1 Tax=Saccharolobus shibatae TaxID=2286 RepID=UPI001C470137|nr:(Fe-S)-binding protein [Saccharolobus shibatae]
MKPNYEVVHITELLVKWYEDGEFTINPIDKTITWHDPCQLGKRGGVFEAPRVLMKALSKQFKELPNHGVNSFCCSGGGGLCMMPKTLEDLAKNSGIGVTEDDKKFLDNAKVTLINAGKVKVDEISKTKAELVLTGCPTCIDTMKFQVNHYRNSSQIMHIIDILYDRIQVKK